jgi:hypothetical protein
VTIAAIDHRVEITVSATWATETIGREIARTLGSMEPGALELAVNDVEFVVRYEQDGAVGDNGQPVAGDVTGDYTVIGPRDRRFYQHVGPHGTSGYGNPRARSWAAEQVGRRIAETVHRISPRRRSF